MQIRVFFTPMEIVLHEKAAHDIYIVIDAIRATTTLSMLYDRGAARILVAETPEQALASRNLYPERKLCGELHARAIPGFDFGNSPAQFSQEDLMGLELVLSTTNGTRALHACPVGATILAGSFFNAHAVTSEALALARRRQSDISIVCAAENRYFDFADSTCAGQLVFELLHRDPRLDVQESALAALMLHRQNPPQESSEQWGSVRQVMEAGLEADLEFCLNRIGASNSVPAVTGLEAETGLLSLENLGSGKTYEHHIDLLIER